jgi:TolB-like protein
MGNLFAELKRRHIYRVAAAYAVVAWVLLQIVNNLAPGLNLPSWAVTLVIVLLFIGFPITLLAAWARDLAPSDGTAQQPATTRLDYVLAGALIVVIALVSYQQLAPSAGAGTDQQATFAPPALSAQSAGISLAVLPFANLSGDPTQEFFSDGITEEITSALARVQGLTVLARTSAFEFKGQSRNVRSIGEALNARYLIEGSVRKDGDRVRITVQLVQAESGANMWTENYDRQLTNIFAIQEDIAQAIAGALKVPLGLERGETLVRGRTGSIDSYEEYLRARALRRSAAINEMITLLEPVAARDPGFAPASSLLALGYWLAPGYTQGEVLGAPLEEGRQAVQLANVKAERAAREAIRLNPKDALAYAVLARIPSAAPSWAESEDLYRQALALDPTESDTLLSYAGRLAQMGRLKTALEVEGKLRTLEPFAPVYSAAYARDLQLNGQNRAAISILEAMPADDVGSRNLYLARAYAVEGRFAEAADTLLASSRASFSRGSVEDAARLLRSAPAKASAPETLPALEGALTFVYAYVGALERVLVVWKRPVGSLL